MAWSATSAYLVASTIRDALKDSSSLKLGEDTTDVIKVALFSTSCSPDATADNQAYATSPWTVGVECTGTNWAAGGVALSITATGEGITKDASGNLKWDAADVSVTGTTIATAAYGCILWDDTVTTPTADPVIVSIYFGGSGYTTNNGTFGIQWNASGIWTIDCTP